VLISAFAVRHIPFFNEHASGAIASRVSDRRAGATTP